MRKCECVCVGVCVYCIRISNSLTLINRHREKEKEGKGRTHALHTTTVGIRRKPHWLSQSYRTAIIQTHIENPYFGVNECMLDIDDDDDEDDEFFERDNVASV